MRFILTAAVWTVIIALLSLLFSARDGNIPSVQNKKVSVYTQVSFEITTTFAVEDDPFALSIGDEAAAFEMLLDGKTVFSKKEGIKDRESFETENFEVTKGTHELFIKANPSDNSISQAVRIRVLEHGNPLSEKTFWFTPGQIVNASYIFETSEEGGNDEH